VLFDVLECPTIQTADATAPTWRTFRDILAQKDRANMAQCANMAQK